MTWHLMSMKLMEELKAISLEEKVALLRQRRDVVDFFCRRPEAKSFIGSRPFDEQYLLLLPVVLGQGEVLYGGVEDWSQAEGLLDVLRNLETVYAPIGGVLGYHAVFLKLLGEEVKGEMQILSPPFIDLGDGAGQMPEAVRAGIASLPLLAEIYPVGGAGDRLGLYDDKSGKPLPAAMLPFCGRTLLELLMRDLQAREYLYYKVEGKQVTVPVAMMTSYEKDNDRYIADIIERCSSFGRSAESFSFFVQPLVPVITAEGQWAVKRPLELLVKPGGHGVLWRCAIAAGVFDRLREQGKKKALVRQINNPFAGIDGGLLAFAGIGCSEDKAFGFASCPRRVGASEGMNVLLAERVEEGVEYRITNVEYTDFKKCGIEDVPSEPGGIYSRFPANTNILFIDLAAVEKAVEVSPIPGLIINLKNKVNVLGREVPAGRLESTMQNIADVIVDTFSEDCAPQRLKTFLTQNRRSKTISVAKKSYQEGGSLLETPPGCFEELQSCYRELLVDHCGMAVAPAVSEEQYLKEGPSFYFLFHPALGPLWSVIRQKIRGGSLAEGAELQLEIAEIEIEGVAIDGSLVVEATDPLGLPNEEGHIVYSDRGGKCTLKNVIVHNQGIDRSCKQQWWKNDLQRHELLHIVIHGDGEFYAEDVEFQGDVKIDVPAGIKLTAYCEGGELRYREEPLKAPSWSWLYRYDGRNKICLERSMKGHP